MFSPAGTHLLRQTSTLSNAVQGILNTASDSALRHLLLSGANRPLSNMPASPADVTSRGATADRSALPNSASRRSLHSVLRTISKISIPNEQLVRIESISWRHVRKEFATQPLSALGSVLTVGGRVNPGAHAVVGSRASPFAALYLADSPMTARCEVTGEICDLRLDCPAPADAVPGYVLFPVRTEVDRVFDCTNRTAIAFLAKKLTASVAEINEALAGGWTFLPNEMGVPSLSQKLAALMRSSGCIGIKFYSTKHRGATCLAIFPEALATDSVVSPLAPAQGADGMDLAQIDMSPLSSGALKDLGRAVTFRRAGWASQANATAERIYEVLESLAADAPGNAAERLCGDGSSELAEAVELASNATRTGVGRSDHVAPLAHIARLLLPTRQALQAKGVDGIQHVYDGYSAMIRDGSGGDLYPNAMAALATISLRPGAEILLGIVYDAACTHRYLMANGSVQAREYIKRQAECQRNARSNAMSWATAMGAPEDLDLARSSEAPLLSIDQYRRANLAQDIILSRQFAEKPLNQLQLQRHGSTGIGARTLHELSASAKKTAYQVREEDIARQWKSEARQERQEVEKRKSEVSYNRGIAWERNTMRQELMVAGFKALTARPLREAKAGCVPALGPTATRNSTRRVAQGQVLNSRPAPSIGAPGYGSRSFVTAAASTELTRSTGAGIQAHVWSESPEQLYMNATMTFAGQTEAGIVTFNGSVQCSEQEHPGARLAQLTQRRERPQITRADPAPHITDAGSRGGVKFIQVDHRERQVLLATRGGIKFDADSGSRYELSSSKLRLR